MSRALFTGVTGLRSHQTMLDVVGNNLANINTVGFKSQRVAFQDLFFQTISRSTGPTGQNVGGTNPLQVGLGSRVGSIDTDLQQGVLQLTGRDLDLAIQGNGYFVLNDGFQNMYTRAGAFSIDPNNILVDLSRGLRVQRTGTVGEATATTPAFQVSGDSSIRIPLGASLPGQITNNVTFRGNLSAQLTGPQAAVLTSRQPFRAAGVAATGATLLNNLDSNTVDYAAGGQIRLDGRTAAGAVVNVVVPVNATTTMTDLLAAINTNFPGSTAALDATGNLVLTANTTGPTQLSLTITDVAGGTTNWGNHAMAVTTVGKDGDKVPTAMQIFDAQGTPHTLSLSFQKVGTNTWNLTASIPTAEGTMVDAVVNGITFNDDGSFRTISGTGAGDPDITIQFPSIAMSQTINLFFGSVNGTDGLTQFGGPTSAAAISQDGFAAGFLSNLSVGQDGIIQGIFTNGRSLAIAQVALAEFSNAGGLQREGNNLFSLSSNSGPPLIGGALSGGRGAIQRGTLETSNVDTALEFTRLIIAQRGFQVNARTISVSDQMLQELANIIR